MLPLFFGSPFQSNTRRGQLFLFFILSCDLCYNPGIAQCWHTTRKSTHNKEYIQDLKQVLEEHLLAIAGGELQLWPTSPKTLGLCASRNIILSLPLFFFLTQPAAEQSTAMCWHHQLLFWTLYPNSILAPQPPFYYVYIDVQYIIEWEGESWEILGEREIKRVFTVDLARTMLQMAGPAMLLAYTRYNCMLWFIDYMTWSRAQHGVV